VAASGHVSAGAANKCDEFPSPHGFARAEDYNRVSKEYHIFGSRIVIRYTQADISLSPTNVRFTPKADIRCRDWHVRLVPKADICTAAIRDLLEQVLTNFRQQWRGL